ncbi:MAG: N5-carboxyaminoimidazole ribonucleotide mutase, partial [uncultured Rubrobacteraceae bacterium]
DPARGHPGRRRGRPPHTRAMHRAPGRVRHRARGGGQGRPQNPRVRLRVRWHRPRARPQGHNLRRRHVGPPGRRRRVPHEPPRHRRPDSLRYARRLRLLAGYGPDARRRPRGDRSGKRRRKRRGARRPDPRALGLGPGGEVGRL